MNTIWSDPVIMAEVPKFVTPCADDVNKAAGRAAHILQSITTFQKIEAAAFEHLKILTRARTELPYVSPPSNVPISKQDWHSRYKNVERMRDEMPLLKPLQFMMDDIRTTVVKDDGYSIHDDMMNDHLTVLHQAIQHEIKCQQLRETHLVDLGTNMANNYGSVRIYLRAALKHVRALRHVQNANSASTWTKKVLEMLHIHDAVRKFQTGDREVRYNDTWHIGPQSG